LYIIPSIILVEYIFLYILNYVHFIIISLKIVCQQFLKDISDIKKSVKEDVDEEVADDQIGHVLKKMCPSIFIPFVFA
jgi:hypothetical protein